MRLTRAEIKRLEVAAAADLRAPASLVAKLLGDHLRRSPAAQRRRRRQVLGRPTDRRVAYDVAVWLRPADREGLETRAQRDARSVANYVTKVGVEHLRGR